MDTRIESRDVSKSTGTGLIPVATQDHDPSLRHRSITDSGNRDEVSEDQDTTGSGKGGDNAEKKSNNGITNASEMMVYDDMDGGTATCYVSSNTNMNTKIEKRSVSRSTGTGYFHDPLLPPQSITEKNNNDDVSSATDNRQENMVEDSDDGRTISTGDQYTNVALSSAHTENRDVGTDATKTQGLIPKPRQAHDPLPLTTSDTGNQTSNSNRDKQAELGADTATSGGSDWNPRTPSRDVPPDDLQLEMETSEDILHSINADHSYVRSCNALSKNDRYKTEKKTNSDVSSGSNKRQGIMVDGNVNGRTTKSCVVSDNQIQMDADIAASCDSGWNCGTSNQGVPLDDLNPTFKDLEWEVQQLFDSGDFETRPENVDLNTAPPPPDVDKSSN